MNSKGQKFKKIDTEAKTNKFSLKLPKDFLNFVIFLFLF